MKYKYALLVVALLVLSFALGLSLGKLKCSTTIIQTGCETEKVMLKQCLTAVDFYKKQLETGRVEGCPKTAVDTLGEYFCGSRAKNIRYDRDNESNIMVTCYDGRVLNFTGV